jgi:hypothetical protein
VSCQHFVASCHRSVSDCELLTPEGGPRDARSLGPSSFDTVGRFADLVPALGGLAEEARAMREVAALGFAGAPKLSYLPRTVRS